MNDCRFIGRLGQDIELKKTASGKSVINFSLCCRSRNGDRWVKFTAWDKAADTICHYVKKGGQIAINAEYDPEQYEKNGVKITSPRFTVITYELLGSKPKDDPAAETYQPHTFDFNEEDLPF